MLRHKAQIQCARLAFGFADLHDPDEGERIIDMGAADEVAPRGAKADLMPRAIKHDPSPTLADMAMAEQARQREPVYADFTAAPNRFAPDPPPAARAKRPSSKPPPEENATNYQPGMFTENPAASGGEQGPSEPVPQNMLNVLRRKMEIAGKTEVDLQAKFGIGLAGITKANFGDIQTWATGP
jgi:hypothetical protein